MIGAQNANRESFRFSRLLPQQDRFLCGPSRYIMAGLYIKLLRYRVHKVQTVEELIQVCAISI